MTDYVTSADGTRIAYDCLGDGPPIVLAAGIFSDRQQLAPLAVELARSFRVYNFDRRGRGESGDNESYTAEREVEDIAAVIAAAGGTAALYGHSSGAGLALNAAAARLPISKLILHEPLYSADDESKAWALRLYGEVKAALAEDRRGDAIAMFFEGFGLPPEEIEDMTNDAAMLHFAGTMLHDFEVMGDNRGEGVVEAKVRAIAVPTLVLAGSETQEFFRDVATTITALLPDGRYVILEGQEHAAAPEVVAPIVAAFLNA